METAIEAFQKGYEAMGAVREDMASKDILQQVYAGQTPEEIKDPIKQAATLQSAAGMLQAKGLNSAAYKLQKQAGDLSTDVNKQELDQIKVKQGILEYAGQLLPSASSDEDLTAAFSGVKDTLAQMQIKRVIDNKNLTIDQKKQVLGNMAKTVDQQLRAQQLTLTALNRASEIQNRNENNVRADKDLALKQAEMYTKAEKPIPEPIAKAAGLLPSGAPDTTGSTIGTDLSKGLQSKIVSGQRSNEDLYNESVKAGRPGKTATGLPIAKPGTSQHEVDNAIDLPKNLSKEERRELAQKGYFQPLGTDSVHWEKIVAKPTEAAGGGLSLDKVNRNSEKASTDTPTSFVGASGDTYTPQDPKEKQIFANVAGPYKQPGVNNINKNNSVTVAANEMKIGLENLSTLTNKGEKVPSRGAFSNLKTDSLFGAVASAATGPLSDLDTQQFEALALPLVRQQATLILGSGASQSDRAQLEKSLMTQANAQSPVLAYQKLAEFAQSARAGIEGQAANPTLNKAQRESLVKAYQAINKAYPFDTKDVLEWQQKGGNQKFGDYIAEKYPNASASSASSTKTKSGVDTSNPWLQ
jgi:hypothetical protein